MTLTFCRLASLAVALLLCHIPLTAQTATATTLSILSSGSPVTTATPGTVITLSAAVSGGASPITGGTVCFCDSIVSNCMLLPTGTAQVVNGTATFKTILPASSYSFTAIYVPATGYSSSTSPAATLSISSSLPTTTALANNSHTASTYLLGIGVTSQALPPPTGTFSINDTTAGTVLASGNLTRLSALNVSVTPAAQPTGDSRGACATVTGDFNGDGRPDLAIGSGCKALDNQNSATALQILLNNGDGTFSAGPTVPAAMTNTNVTALAVGDFNNDGTLDLIAADYKYQLVSGNPITYTQHLYLLANNGTGTFTASQLSSSCASSELVTADFNHDGNLDFAANCSASLNSLPSIGNPYVFLGTGTGTFSPTSASTDLFSGAPQNAFAVGDFNNDGYPDIVGLVGTSGGSGVAVYTNAGNGTTFTRTDVMTVPHPVGVLALDFNGDGNEDIVAFGQTYFSYDPAGTTTTHFVAGNGHTVFGSDTAGISAADSSTSGTSMATGDFNHDGITDYAIVAHNLIGVVLGSTTRSWPAGSLALAVAIPNEFPSAIADVDGDGIPDVVASNSDQSHAAIYTIGGSAYSSPSASIIVNVVGSGTHAVNATYSGDTAYATSTSNTLNLTAGTVSTSLSLSESPNPAYLGMPVALTATLQPYNGSSITTNGEIVTFYSGSAVLGTATLMNGTAVLTTSGLPLGQASITASYPGDTNFAAATSSPLVFTVKDPHPPTVNTTSITFPTITLDSATSSNTQTVTLTNTDTNPITISSIQLTGNGITQTTTCGTSLAGSASCYIALTFAPSVPGSVSGALTINTSSVTPTLTVNLSARAVINVTPQVTATPDMAVAGTPITVTATYPATSHGLSTNGMTVWFSYVSPTDVVSAGSRTLLNGTATITVTGLPAGDYAMYVYLPGDSNFMAATSDPYPVILSAPTYPTVTPNAVDFGSVTIGSSVTRPVTLTNTTTSSLTVAAVTVTGNFTQTNNCGVLAASASCIANVTFAPAAPGTSNGTLAFSANPTTPINTANLTGTGVAVTPTLHLVPSATSVSVGTQVSLTATLTPFASGSLSSNGKTVTFTSGSTTLGTVALTNGTAVFSTSTLPIGSSSITATFNGDTNFVSATSNTATIVVAAVTPTLHLASSPASAPLGAPVTLTATLAPYSSGSLSTNGRTITFTSGASTLGTGTLTNGVATLSLSSLPLGVNSIVAAFTGDTNFTSVTSSAATVTISAPPAPTVNPTSVSFGAISTGTSATQTVNVTNTSTGPLTIASVVASSGFTQTNTCGTTLAASAACAITVTYAPTTAGATTGSLVITTNASAPITTISLSGSGAASALSLTASSASVTLGTPVALSVTLTPYTNGSVSSNGKSVTFASGGAVLGTAILNNGIATLNTSALPVGSNAITATFTGDANFPSATSNSVTVTVAAVSSTLTLAASPASASLGNPVVLTATLSPYSAGTNTTNGKTVTFTKGGTALGTATLTNGVATLSLTTLPVGSNSITATFTGDTNFASATSSAAVVIITGPTAPTVTPTSIDFGTVTLGNSPTQTVTLTNTAASPLTISAVTITGGFTQTNTCGVLAVSASCTATVTFAPSAATTSNGTLTFTTNAVTATTTVSITGTGAASVTTSIGSGSLGTIKPGTTGTLPISFAVAPGVSGTLTTTCTIALTTGGTATTPPTCSTSPSSFTVTGGSTVNTTLTITTTGSSAAMHLPASGLTLAGGLLGLLALIRRKPKLASLLLLLLSLTAIGSITGCGTSGGGSTSSGGGSSTPSTTPGTYTVTVKATIGTQTSSVNLPLTIQ